MSQAPQQFCVRWNSYHTNLQTVFPKLLTTENFVDVTLACENRQIKCHKVVLSACSTYFERLLIQNPCKHPIIFMKDMRFSEMQSLVDFMYKGEVNVSQDDLPSLLKSAEALQIRGLCGSESAGGAPPELPVAPAPQIAIPLVPSGHMTGTTSPRDHADNTNHSSKTSSLPPVSPAPPSTPSPVSNGPTRRRRTHLDPPSAGAPHATNGERSPPDPNNSTHNTGTTMKLRRADSLKQETVEEDGLYYGDIDLGEMDCSDQAEEDLLQTGNISGQPTADVKKPLIRVKKQSELCDKSKKRRIEESLLNRLQLCPQITFKTYQKNGRDDCLKNAKEIINTEPKIESNPSYKKVLVTSQSTENTALDAKKVVEEEKFDEQIYEDEEYLQMWLLQNQQLEVSLSNGNNEMQTFNKTPKAVKTEVVKPASISKKLGKKSTPSDQEKWLQYYTNNFATPKDRDSAYLDYVFTGKKRDKSAKKKAKVGDECLNLLDFLEPADLDQFLAGKEVSSSGVSRNAIEQAMLGKYNPNRRYSNEAMWAALMDVKKGGSIYRAAQTHKVPRKSLRNWMKRWHIKSSFPMPQQLKQFVENNKKHKSQLRMDLTTTLLSLGTRNNITPNPLIPPTINTTHQTAKKLKPEDLIDSQTFNHFLDSDYYRAGEIRAQTSSGDDIDDKDVKENSITAVKDEFDSGYTQIMDMSGNILFDDGVASNHEEDHIEEGGLKEIDAGEVNNVDSRVANVKKISFSNVEQLAGLDGDLNKMYEA